MKIHKQQSGLISLLTALMVSILLILLATALVSLVTGTQEQSSDNELTLRAYAAAEGGIEWAYAQILAGDPNLAVDFNSCNGTGSLDDLYPGLYSFEDSSGVGDTNENALTCLRILRSDDKTRGKLHYRGEDGDAVNITIPNSALAAPISWVELSWIGADEPWSNAVNPILANQLPSTLAAAAMELTVVHYPVDGSNFVGTNDITIRNILFLPGPGGPQTGAEPKLRGECGRSTTYACRANVFIKQGFATSDPADVFVMQLRPKYLTAGGNNTVSYQMRFFDASGNLLTVPDGFITIDAIARSGSFHRRVEAKVPTTPGGAYGQLNYVLYADTDICKKFSIHREGSNFNLDPSGSTCPQTPAFVP